MQIQKLYFITSWFCMSHLKIFWKVCRFFCLTFPFSYFFLTCFSLYFDWKLTLYFVYAEGGNFLETFSTWINIVNAFESKCPDVRIDFLLCYRVNACDIEEFISVGVLSALKTRGCSSIFQWKRSVVALQLEHLQWFS